MTTPAVIEDGSGMLALITELEGAGMLERTALNIDADMTFDRYEALAAFLGAVQDSCRWWIGDLLNFGEATYGEKYSQAATVTGLSEGTLTNYAYVCRAIARSRRNEKLTFSHHVQVAPLAPREQARWLKRAESRGLTSRLLRDEIRASIGAPQVEQPQWGESEASSFAERVLDAARAVVQHARPQREPEGGAYVPREPWQALVELVEVNT